MKHKKQGVVLTTQTEDERKEAIRLAARAWREKRSERTKLEHAAYQARKVLGKDFDPYTPREREEAEAIRAELEHVLKRAEMLDQEITQRLTRQSDEKIHVLLTFYEQATPTKIYVSRF